MSLLFYKVINVFFVCDKVLIIIHFIYRKWDQFNKVCQIGTQTITKFIAGSGSYMGVSKMITVV